MKKDQILHHCAACADFHLQSAKAHKAAAAESSGPAMEFHKSMAEIHAAHGEHYLKCYKAIDSGEMSIDTNDDSRGTDELKTAAFGIPGARDFSKVRADGVHGALPDMPRLVLRPGQQLVEKTSIDKDTEAIDAFAK